MSISLPKPKPSAVMPHSSVAQQIEFHMGEIKKLFANPKLTLIVRSRALEGPVIFTNEQDPNEIMNAVKSHVEKSSVIKVSGLN